MKIKSLLSCKIILVLLLVFSESSAQQVKSLDKRKFIAWTVDHMPYHILVEDAIVDYNTLNTLENPRIKKKKGDKKLPILKEMRADDLLIIVQQKKSTKNEIHEIWYGNGLNFDIIPREIVDWVLSQDIQEALIEKDQYLNSPSDVVFFESENQRLLASYSSRFSLWKQHNFLLSTEELYLRSNLLQYSANFAFGNTLVGLPGTLFGSTSMGVGTRNSEIGIRFPAKINLLSLGDLKGDKLLREYLGLYSKVTIDNMFSTGASFHAQMGFSFFPRSSTIASDTTFFSRNNIDPKDRYVNIIDMYALFAATFEAPVKIPAISRVTFTPGLHYMKVAHRTKDKDNKLYNRTFYGYDYETNSYNRYGDGDKSSTKEFGLYGRVDLMTEIGVVPKFLQQYEFLDFININKVPLFEVSLQHITKLNTITSVAANINDNVSFSMTIYSGAENGTVEGGWLPEKNLWLGVRYRSDF
jgi:hypothetical protein|tara:strand:+ start:2585 stop:3991 length:1407 start_codon:yes stop_codon:yes gene_type:complete